MLLIVDVDKEKYDAIKSDLYSTFPAEMKEWGLEAIRNGTPLSTGHWIDMDEGFSPCECSECGAIEFNKSNYCPNCGLRMVETQKVRG